MVFYFKIVIQAAHKDRHGVCTSHVDYREFLKAEHIGELVARKLGQKGVRSISVTRIKQETYLKAREAMQANGDRE